MFRIMQHDIPKALIFLAVMETGVLIVSVFFGIKIYLMMMPAVQPPSYILSIAALYSLVIFVSLLAMGWCWYDAEENEAGRLLRLAFGFLIGSTVFFAVAPLLVSRPFDKNLFVIITIVGFIGVLAVHSAYDLIMHQDFFKRRIMVLGAGERASQLAQSTWHNIKVVGYVPHAERQVKVAEGKLLVSGQSLREIAKKKQCQGNCCGPG
jgi:FlaA1/EpsC-like NDP-sugar epimerase